MRIQLFAFYFFVFKDDITCVIVHSLKLSRNLILVVCCEVEDNEVDTVVFAIVGAHSLNGIEPAINLLRQLKVARSSLRGHREVKYVVIELLL